MRGTTCHAPVAPRGQAPSLIARPAIAAPEEATPTRSLGWLIPLTLIVASAPLAGADPIDPQNPPSLEELLSTQPAGLVQAGNPWLNPGFEATSGAALGTYGVPSAPQYASVAPPTVVYVDDAGPAVNTTYEVCVGCGTSGNALQIRYEGDESDRNLLVAQFFGVDGAPYVWENATHFAFDVKSSAKLEEMHVSVYYTDPATGASARAAGFQYFPAGAFGWTRYHTPIDFPAVPVGAEIRSALFRIRTLEDATVTIDNIEIEGATMVVDTRSDLTDGYTLVLEPQGASDVSPTPAVPSFTTGLGERYLINAHAVDYTDVTPRSVPLAAVGGTAISVLASEFFSSPSPGGFAVPAATARNATDPSMMVFAIDNATALAASQDGLAGLWAFMSVGPQYENPPGNLNEPTSGYFSVARNQIAGYTLADAFDYAASIVELAGTAGPVAVDQELAFLDPVGAGFDVRVTSATTGWIETTTVTVPGVGSATVTLPGTGQPAFAHFPGDLPAGATATSASTIFTIGGFASGDLPVASFVMCEDAPGCGTAIAEIVSLTTVSFDASASTDPLGRELADYTWSFGDAGAGATGEQATFLYSGPGTFDVTLTVTTVDGRSASMTQSIVVTNRAPTAALELSAATTSRLADLTASVTASDDDGEIATVLLELDGAAFDSAAGASADFEVGAGLALGEHLLEAYAVDDLGALSPLANATFTVVNLAPAATLAASDALVAGSQDVTLAFGASDADSPGAVATVLRLGDGTSLANATSPLVHAYAATGAYTVSFEATDSEGATTTRTVTITVDATPPATTATLPAVPAGGWFAGPVLVTLAATDNVPGASIAYAVDEGLDASTTYTAPFEVSGDGAHTVSYRGTDAVGNVEPTTNTVTFQIDATAPAVDGSGLPADGDVITEAQTLSGAATDAGSGVASVRLLIDGVEVASGTTSVAYAWDHTQHAGPVEITLEASDVAGNANATTVNVIVVPLPDLGLPEAPEPPASPVETTECDGYPVTDATPTGTGPWPTAAGECAPGRNLVYAWGCVGYAGNVDRFGASAGFPTPGAATPHPVQDAAIAQAIATAIAEGAFAPEDVHVSYSAQNESSGGGCS